MKKSWPKRDSNSDLLRGKPWCLPLLHTILLFFTLCFVIVRASFHCIVVYKAKVQKYVQSVYTKSILWFRCNNDRMKFFMSEKRKRQLIIANRSKIIVFVCYLDQYYFYFDENVPSRRWIAKKKKCSHCDSNHRTRIWKKITKPERYRALIE